ncbi:MAG: translation elongation factor Ts [Planctomycetota bacterium]|nr:MAG: translation elongation factor Ts [Planctomycetota bacterium]
MVEIGAAAVKSLREKTGLPIMKCKQALQATDGDEQGAIEWLRKDNIKVQESRGGRETAFGRIGLYVDWDAGVGAMVEVKCESAPVAGNDEFIALAADLARQLATGKGAASGEELLDQASPSDSGKTLRDQMLDASNRIREVFKIGRVARLDGKCSGYVHHAGRTVGVLLEVEGGNPEAAKDICLHIASMSPQVLSKEDLPADEVEKEREILSEAARNEGKPDNIIAKMVEGRLRNFFAERVLLEQAFVKDDKKTVAKFAKENDMKIVKYIHWELGKE